MDRKLLTGVLMRDFHIEQVRHEDAVEKIGSDDDNAEVQL